MVRLGGPGPRVLEVVDTLGMGGAETWLVEMLRFWRQQGYGPQVDILATSGNRGIFDDECRALGARIHYLRYGRQSLPAFIKGFRRLLKTGAYDVIHDHQAYASGWHFLMGAGLLPPVRITHLHNAAYQIRTGSRSQQLFGRMGRRLIGRFATHIAATSQQLIDDYDFNTEAFAGISKLAVHCGFDTERSLGDTAAAHASICREFGWPKGVKIILSAGRLDPSPEVDHPTNQKNSGFAVRVGIACAKRDPLVRMVLAGQLSPAVGELQGLAAAEGYDGKIQFLGIRRDLKSLMLASEVLLFPSRSEGLGMVAVEAQAAGLPVLASTGVPQECVVVPELVRFLDIGSGVEAWASELLELIALPHDRLTANLEVASSSFSVQSSSAVLSDLYSPPPRVLQIVDSLSMGGAETWLMELLRFWRAQGAGAPRVDILATSGRPGIFDDEARALGANIFYLPFGRTHLPSFVSGFRKILKRGRYAAIHDHQGYVSGWHFFLGSGLLPPVRVTHLHNPYYQHQIGSVFRRAMGEMGQNLVGRYATRITGTSRHVLAEYGFDAASFRGPTGKALYCGFDPERFLVDAKVQRDEVRREFGWPDDARIILFAGRLDQSADPGAPENHKNSGFALSVGLECARRDARVRMLFAGASSPAVSILNERIAAAGKSGCIEFLGVRRDIARLMVASDALLFPSRAEGLGMVAVEAQAAGLPVLASTAVPDECVVVPELVRFRALTDSVEDWASELMELMAQPHDVRRANAKVANSSFAVAHSAHALTEMYAGRPAP